MAAHSPEYKRLTSPSKAQCVLLGLFVLSLLNIVYCSDTFELPNRQHCFPMIKFICTADTV